MHVCFSFVKRKQRLTISMKKKMRKKKTKNRIATLIITNKQKKTKQKKNKNTHRFYSYWSVKQNYRNTHIWVYMYIRKGTYSATVGRCRWEVNCSEEREGRGGGENTHASSERKERKPCILGLQVQERGMIPQNHNNNREIKQNNKNEKKNAVVPINAWSSASLRMLR